MTTQTYQSATRLLQALRSPLDVSLERANALPAVKSAAEEALRHFAGKPLPLLTEDEAKAALKAARIGLRTAPVLNAIAAASGSTVTAVNRLL